MAFNPHTQPAGIGGVSPQLLRRVFSSECLRGPPKVTQLESGKVELNTDCLRQTDGLIPKWALKSWGQGAELGLELL